MPDLDDAFFKQSCFIGFGLLICVCMRLDERGSCEYLFVGVCVLIFRGSSKSKSGCDGFIQAKVSMMIIDHLSSFLFFWFFITYFFFLLSYQFCIAQIPFRRLFSSNSSNRNFMWMVCLNKIIKIIITDSMKRSNDRQIFVFIKS